MRKDVDSKDLPVAYRAISTIGDSIGGILKAFINLLSSPAFAYFFSASILVVAISAAISVPLLARQHEWDLYGSKVPLPKGKIMDRSCINRGNDNKPVKSEAIEKSEQEPNVFIGYRVSCADGYVFDSP